MLFYKSDQFRDGRWSYEKEIDLGECKCFLREPGDQLFAGRTVREDDEPHYPAPLGKLSHADRFAV